MKKFCYRKFSESIKENKFYKILGFVTVKQNERAAIYNRNGEISLVDGPKTKFVYRSSVEFLPWFTANPNQFIKISYLKGVEEHISGPSSICFDPINHKEISVLDSWTLKHNEHGIIYEKSYEDGSIKPKTLSGPTFYFPQPNETMAYYAKNVTAAATQYIEISFQDGKTKFLPGPVKIINDPTLYASMKVKDAKKLTTNQGLIIYQEKSPNEIQVKTILGPAIYIPDSNEWIHKEINLITVNPNEYLEINYIDGKKEFIQGPYSLWENPITIESIVKKPVFNIDENECIIVYSGVNGKILRNIIKGPTQYVPKSNEWIHHFNWHGSDPNNTTRKIPNALKFVKLRLVPDQLYFDVDNVRTRDDAELTIKLMIFYKIESVDKLLDKSHDPVADLINAVTSDVIDFVSKYKFEEFKNQIEKLSDLNTYSQIMARSQAIGYNISKIVFRGYVASRSLETMHNNSIEARTKLVLDHEIEFQQQQIKDFQQQKQKERLEDKLKMDYDEMKMKLDIETMELEYRLKNKKLEMEAELKIENSRKVEERNQLKKQNELELEIVELKNKIDINMQKENNDEEIRKYLGMKEMGVNLTDYLIAKEKGSPSKWIQVDSNNDISNQVHVINKIS